MTTSADMARGGRMPRSARRKQLLSAARAVFVEHGYHAAAMDEIALRAGVSKPVLYQHFPGKLELYLALIDVQAESLSAALARALRATDDNRARIHGVLSAYFDFVDGAPDGEAGAFRLIFETDLGNDPEVRARVDAVTTATERAIADVVAADTGLDPASANLLSVSLIGAAQTAAGWWVDSEHPLPKDQAINLLESLLWRGISNFPRH